MKLFYLIENFKGSVISKNQSVFSDAEAFLLASQFLPVVQLSLFGNDCITFCDIVDRKVISRVENVIKAVVNVCILWSYLEGWLCELSRLGFYFDVCFSFVQLLMLQLVLIRIIDLIKLFTFKLLRLDQRIIESRLNRKWLLNLL